MKAISFNLAGTSSILVNFFAKNRENAIFGEKLKIFKENF